MMGVRRVLQRLLVVLMFVCVTVKIQLELGLLHQSLGSNHYSPWWANETLAHLRTFPKGHTLRHGVYATHANAVHSNATHTNASSIQNNHLNESSKSTMLNNDRHDKENSDHKGKADKIEERGAARRWAMFARLGLAVNGSTVSLYHKMLQKETARQKILANKEKIINLGRKTKTNKKEGNISVQQKKQVRQVKPSKKAVAAAVRRGVSHDVDHTEVSLSPADIARIRQLQQEANERQTVHNQDKFGAVQPNTSVLLVQVHKRLTNLRYLVQSLERVRGIQEALVIISHDLWDDQLNAFVANITSFRVMQIYFPFSIQLHPFSFPGRDPRDCPWNGKKGKVGCLNERWADGYGHYREAAFTQIKHHWWWKIHRVFEDVRVTSNNFTGHVVFLEEDHYVFPDLLHVLDLMRRLRPALCPECRVLALGNYNKLSPAVYKNQVEKGEWSVAKFNMGFALDALAWRHIFSPLCKKHFCLYDDYNWDWTMANVVQTCHTNPRVTMLVTRLSRVTHVGSCGTHVKRSTCDVGREVKLASTRILSCAKWLYPQTLVMSATYRGAAKMKKGNGGWGDYRDRQLCLAIANGSASHHTVARLQPDPHPTVNTTLSHHTNARLQPGPHPTVNTTLSHHTIARLQPDPHPTKKATINTTLSHLASGRLQLNPKTFKILQDNSTVQVNHAPKDISSINKSHAITNTTTKM